MGNNNSASSPHVDPRSQWNSPDPHLDFRKEKDDGKNRMRRGYNPPKKYMGHLVPPPQKVLPAVNPAKAAKKLKLTSNGVNLKQCGTISGRKLNENGLDLIPRTTIVDVVDGKRGERRLNRMHPSEIPGLVRQSGMSSPNLLENGDEIRMRGGDFESRQNSRLNRGQGRGFHESEPELRHSQLQRSTALGFPTHLPIPPLPASHIQESAAKKQIRSKKKKTAPPPPLVTSKKSNSFLHQPPKSPPTPPLVAEITKAHQRIFKTKAEGRLSSSSAETKPQNGRSQPSGSSVRTDSRNSTTSTSITPGKENGLMKSSPGKIKALDMRRQNSTPPPSYDQNAQAQWKPGAPNIKPPPLEIVPVQKHYIPYSSGIEMPSSEFRTKETVAKPSGGKGSQNVPEKKCFYFGMDREGFRPKTPDKRRNVAEVAKNINPYVKSGDGRQQVANYKDDPREESLSDNVSTSSEMDIVLRPTLPPKRTQLPKFSPSAAWNRIDLDSPNSSEEDALRFNPRKGPVGGVTHADVKEPNPNEGDSGISGLDGDGGGTPEILPIQPLPLGSKGKCWTPEQDLDESSSEFEAEEDGIRQGGRMSKVPVQSVSCQGPSDRARLTTRRNFFTNSKSDTEGTTKVDEPIYARSTKSKGGESVTVVDKGDEGPLLSSLPQNHPLEFKPSLNRIINYRRTVNNKEVAAGLDTNWFLSRSEPNSLNLAHLMIGDGYEAGRRSGRELEPDDDEVGIRSENGYGPTTKLNYENVDENSLNWNKSASLISLSHLVYLPQSHSAMDETAGGGKRNRRAKSVENLLNQNDRKNNRVGGGPQYDKMKNQSPSQLPQHRQQVNKRKKFKFQSTLKVLERKQIEKELSREAEEKELERLQEIEAMKRVEAEFQKKRKIREAEKDTVEPSGSVIILNTHQPSVVVTLRQWEDEEQIQRPASQLRSASSTPCQFSHKSSNSTRSSNLSKVHLTQRQDPEGAPSIQDLRKELIIGAKKRNGISSASSDLTQELSEYRQETRQYCDYRSSPRLNMDVSSKSRLRNKFVDSTSSDIYPLTGRTPLDKHGQRPKSTVVYPEIVCDIPNKPFPYMVNFSSRLSGSHTSLLIEERPPSGVGYTSGPSSVISDNYRRDWAHHHGKPSGSSIGNAGKSSSITSLHSTSEYPRQALDPKESSIDSPKIFHRVLGSRSSEMKESENIRHTMNVLNDSVMEKRGPAQMKSESCLQPQSYISYKTKSYRPVIFNPGNSSSRP